VLCARPRPHTLESHKLYAFNIQVGSCFLAFIKIHTKFKKFSIKIYFRPKTLYQILRNKMSLNFSALQVRNSTGNYTFVPVNGLQPNLEIVTFNQE